MILRRTCSFLLLAAGMAAGGCASDQAERHAHATQRLDFSLANPRITYELGLNCELRVTLPPPPPDSGCVWEIVGNNALVLEQQGPLRAGEAVGGGGAGPSVVVFYSLKLGRSVLRFVLVHPKEDEALALARCEATVRVLDDRPGS